MIPLPESFRGKSNTRKYDTAPPYLPVIYWWGWEALAGKHAYTQSLWYPEKQQDTRRGVQSNATMHFHYTISGLGHVEVNGRAYAVPPGHAFIVTYPNNATFGPHPDAPGQPWETLGLFINRGFHLSLLIDMLMSRVPTLHLHDEHPILVSLCEMIQTDTSTGFPSSEDFAQAILPFFLAVGQECWPPKEIVNDISSVVAYIVEHSHQPLTLPEIAARFAYSPAYLSRLFHRQIGYPLMDFLGRIRVYRTLTQADKLGVTLEQASRMCGYQNQITFYRATRRFTGESPSQLLHLAWYHLMERIWTTPPPEQLISELKSISLHNASKKAKHVGR